MGVSNLPKVVAWRLPLDRYQIILLGDKRHMGVNNLPRVVTR